MSTLETIKSAVMRASPDERRELREWLAGFTDGAEWTPETLRQAVEAGMDDLEQGRFEEHDDGGLAELFNEVRERGLKQLAARGSR